LGSSLEEGRRGVFTGSRFPLPIFIFLFCPGGGGERRRPSPAIFSSMASMLEIDAGGSEERQRPRQLHRQQTRTLAEGGGVERGNHGGVRRGDLEARRGANRGDGDVGGEGSTHGRTKKRSLTQGTRRTLNHRGGGTGRRRRMKEMRVGASVGSDKGERG
jgi:hypothetical protein